MIFFSWPLKKTKSATSQKRLYVTYKDKNALFGTHVLEPFKYRHLGQDVARALNLVEREDGSKVKNHINLDMTNFSIEEVGDYQDQVNAMNLSAQAEEDGDSEAIDL